MNFSFAAPQITPSTTSSTSPVRITFVHPGTDPLANLKRSNISHHVLHHTTKISELHTSVTTVSSGNLPI